MTTPGALELLTWNESTSQLCLNPQALDFMRKIPGPLSVVSVAGMYRTGKSYLLNRVLLNKNRAFTVGPTINPCTRGLWIWGEALAGTQEDTTPCSVLVIDSEGIGGLERDCNYDTRIFAIASIISSIFIYNSTGAIDETAIDSLSLIVNISKMIQASSPSSFFPRFLWVLRDFALQLIDEHGNNIDPNEYLEKTLGLRPGFSDSVEKKNRIRNMLKGFYQERECVPLIRPTNVDTDLQRLDEVEVDKLRPEFVQQIMDLRKKVLFKAKVKRICGAEVNGELLVRLIEDCVKAFNEGSVPNIDSAWGYISKSHNRKVVERSVEEYDRYLGDIGFPIEESELEGVHKDAKAEGQGYLKKNLLVHDKELYELFKERVNEKFTEAKLQNQYALKMHYMTYLKDLYTSLDSDIKSGKYNSMYLFDKNLKIVEKDYFENCIPGVLKNEIFLTFAKEISSKAADYLISYYSNEVKVQKGTFESYAEKMNSEIKELKDSLAGTKNDLEKQLSKALSELTLAQNKELVYKDQLSKLQTQKEDLEKTIKDLQKYKTGELEELKVKYSNLQNSFQDLTRKHNSEKTELEDQMALLQQKLSFTETSLEEYKNRDKNYSDRLKEFRAEQTQSQRILQSKYEQQIEKLNERLNEKNKENNELENEIEIKEALLEQVQSSLNKSKEEQELYKIKSDQEIADLKNQLAEKEAFFSKKIEKIEQDNKVSTSRLRARLSETEKKLRNSDELLRSDMAIWAQDNAILVQKIEFLEQEVEELKLKLEEEKNRAESIISTFESEQNKNN